MRNEIARFLSAISILVTISTTSLAAEPIIVVKNKTYDIVGSSVRELRKQMDEKGPRGFWGYTQWQYFLALSGCRVKVEIIYTMPNWVMRSEAPKKLRKKWDKFYKALEEHERGHGKHAIAAANEITANNCKNHKTIADKWGEQDKIYDKRTDHGTKTGVRLRE